MELTEKIPEAAFRVSKSQLDRPKYPKSCQNTVHYLLPFNQNRCRLNGFSQASTTFKSGVLYTDAATSTSQVNGRVAEVELRTAPISALLQI